MHYLVRDLAEPPELPPLPDRFGCRTVRAEDIPERVSIHREVWSRPDRPSRVTESSFAQVRAEWPYRESLECVVEAPDVASPRTASAGPTTRTGLASSSRSASGKSSADAASAAPSAASRCGACTRKAGAKRSSTARPSPPAHSTSQWASESMRHWLNTPAPAEIPAIARASVRECHPTPPRGSFVVVVGGGGCIPRAPGGPVDLDRYALRVGSRVDQV